MKHPHDQASPYIQPLQECEQAINRLYALQKYCFEDVFNASFKQLENLSHCYNPEQAMKLNFSFCKGLEAHANYLSDQTYAALSDAQEASLHSWDSTTTSVVEQLDKWLHLGTT